MRDAREIAIDIRKTKWADENVCRELCELAGLAEKWDDTFNEVVAYFGFSPDYSVLEEAAEKLGVCVECVQPYGYRDPEIIAEDIRALDYWDDDLCDELLRAAGMDEDEEEDEFECEDEDEEDDEEDFEYEKEEESRERIMERAAEKLGVKIY